MLSATFGNSISWMCRFLWNHTAGTTTLLVLLTMQCHGGSRLAGIVRASCHQDFPYLPVFFVHKSLEADAVLGGNPDSALWQCFGIKPKCATFFAEPNAFDFPIHIFLFHSSAHLASR